MEPESPNARTRKDESPGSANPGQPAAGSANPATLPAGAVWILAEQTSGILRPTGFELLARGRRLADDLGTPLVAVVLGRALGDAELLRLVSRGADLVLAAEHPLLEHFLPEPATEALVRLVADGKPRILVAAATTEGRSLMPALAVRCRTGLTADCTGLDIDPVSRRLVQTRPAIGGNIMASIESPGRLPQMATVRPHSARPLPPDPSRRGAILRMRFADGELPAGGIRRIALRRDPGEEVAVQDAEVVVAGGRGCRAAWQFGLVRELAAVLGAGVGASRDAVDLGWIGYPHQVGLSGKTISPKLYIAAGISGSIQHLAGIKTAGRIVAVNTDPDAQIFRIADLGVVGSLHEILPRLSARLRELKESGEYHG